MGSTFATLRRASWSLSSIAVFVVLFLAPRLATGQEPVKSFDQLNTRLKPGDMVYVTDAQGHEVEGKILSLSPDALTLNAGSPRTFAARDVNTIRGRQHDALWDGALVGFAVGGGLALGCLAVARDMCLTDIALWGGIGAAIGVGIDALMPGKMAVAYRVPGSAGSGSSARFSFAPVVTPRTKGVAVSLSF
jgi:hypothetical protein